MACEERLRRGHWPRPIPFYLAAFTADNLRRGAPGWIQGFGMQKAFDALQRHGHLARVNLVITFTLAAGAAATVRGYDLFALANVLAFRDAAGHEYFSGLDGRDWIDDYLFRTGRLPTGLPGPVTIGASAQQITIMLPLDLRTTPVGMSDMWDSRPIDGCVPLALLDNRSNAAAVLSGQWAATLPTVAGGLATVTSVDSVDVYIGTYYDEDVYSDAPWVIDVQRSNSRPYVIEIKGQRDGHAIHYSMLRHRTEDAGGVDLNPDYTALKVDHGADNWYAGLTALQAMRLIDGIQPLSELDSFTFNAPTPTIENAYLLGTVDVEVVPLMITPYGGSRAMMGAGPITLDWRSTTHTQARIQSRIITPASVQYQTDVAQILGISVDQLVQDPKKAGAGNGQKMAALLPRAFQSKKAG